MHVLVLLVSGFATTFATSDSVDKTLSLVLEKPAAINGERVLEEFSIHGPMELHETAMDLYIKMRRENPNAASFDDDSPLKRSIEEYAIKRNFMQHSNEIALLKEGGEIASNALLGLPNPTSDSLSHVKAAALISNALSSQSSDKTNSDSHTKYLPLATSTSSSSSSSLSTIPVNNAYLAQANEFNEFVTLGAISKAGGLPHTSDLEKSYVKFAEKKLLRDNSLDHFSVLWELGTGLTEQKYLLENLKNTESNENHDDSNSETTLTTTNTSITGLGFDKANEDTLISKMKEWFHTGGGTLKYIEPIFDYQTKYYRLKATENIAADESVVNIPFKLIMCRQTARNVLIKQKHKYLGEELKKTFEKNEVWGLAIFLLHEYYKEMSGIGSKWGPYIRSLRMRILSTDMLHELKGTMAGKMMTKWLKDADEFSWWSSGSDGPCTIQTGICNTKPNERFGDSRFNNHQLRWAYFVVKQNAVRIKHIATGLDFLALIPFHNMIEQNLISSSKVPSNPHHHPVQVEVQVDGETSHSNTKNNRFDETRNIYDEYIQDVCRIGVSHQETSSMGLFHNKNHLHSNSKSNSNSKDVDAIQGGVSFELDGSITIRTALDVETNGYISLFPIGKLTDTEFFMRYLTLPCHYNPYNEVKISLPGTIPKGSKFHYCMKGSSEERNRDECRTTYKSESMFWKSKVLGEWREAMNLPPRLQELRMWAQRLHMYGTEEEMKLISAANHIIAGLPIPVDQMPAEEQLQLMGVAHSAQEASVMLLGDRPPPQLYTAPDPEEDPEANRAMEYLATMALKARSVYASGNTHLNATQAVLNRTRDFFQHGILPMAGLDDLDDFLLKKIGMLAHCGYENDMKITYNNITDQLLCAMRVHLMNESEVHVFCPKDVMVWEENCHNVEFLNFTAISPSNELNVIMTLKGSIMSMLSSYPHTIEQDIQLLSEYNKKQKMDDSGDDVNDDSKHTNTNKIGPIQSAIIKLRLREKLLLYSGLQFITNYETKVMNSIHDSESDNNNTNSINKNHIVFQLNLKSKERIIADQQQALKQEYINKIKELANKKYDVASIEIDLKNSLYYNESQPKANLTLQEGESLNEVVIRFCQKYGIANNNYEALGNALKVRVKNPPSLELLLGVIVPSSDRMLLGITEGSNATIETNVFCMKYNIDMVDCDKLLRRVYQRLHMPGVSYYDNNGIERHIDIKYTRNVLSTLTIDAPDTRQLKLIIHQGEQHDLVQYIQDFLIYYKMPVENTQVVYNAIINRLPAVALTIPINMSSKRLVVMNIYNNDNITQIVEAFLDTMEFGNDASIKETLIKRARHGMAPGTFLI